MTAFDIVRLVGACIALVVGAIVFLVIFFRGMSWMDRWIKKRDETDLSRRNGKRKKTPPRSHAMDSDSWVREPSTQKWNAREGVIGDESVASLRNQIADKATREPLENGRVRSERLASKPSSAEPDATLDRVLHDLRNDAVVSIEDAEVVAKAVSRIATVHLLSGETIERVAFCPKGKANKICDGIGFAGVVLENDEGQICVVRLENIKMVTWKAQ